MIVSRCPVSPSARMRHVAEDVLRQRFCRWSGCGAIFWICRSCDRGQCYCSEHCRNKARRAQRRAANLRHRKSPEGRLDQRDRQRAYRRRLASVCVMDQASPDPSSTCTIVAPVLFPPASPFIHEPGVPYCVICGKSGRFIDPFHRWR